MGRLACTYLFTRHPSSFISEAVPDDDFAGAAVHRYPFHRERDSVFRIERIPVYIENVIGVAATWKEERITIKQEHL